MDTRTDNYQGYRYAAVAALSPVAVTRWTVQLVDPQVEREFRIDRFPDDRRRVAMLLALASVASAINFLVQLYLYAGGNSGVNAMLTQFFTIWLPLAGLAIVLRLRTPSVLEGVMIGCIGLGMVMRMSIMTLQPGLTFLWPTLIIGIVFVIYIYLPVRFLVAVAISSIFSIVASAWWLLIAETGVPVDQMLRAQVWLLFANALGFIAANSIQRGQRVRYAQSLLLKELLSTDAMTGIGNRRRFDDAFDREWRRCGRSGKPLSLLMIDVDHFKSYNDHHGHLHGDECLRQVAKLLVEGVGRPGDLVARYGGEEFVCLLPEIGEEGARAVAAKFMMAIARAAIPHAALPEAAKLTISIGTATCHEVSLHSPGALVALADKLLYGAKRAGRDQVMTGVL
ncbi:GGDEF domain-containing protein [Microbacteriaceae bacterium K1510]|nr:GGDEF domain-containing protein [Microbacteriaceae bacterium K1510]